MLRLALLTLLLLALPAAAAPAATVGLSEFLVEDDDSGYDREDDSYRYSLLNFRAAPGERNHLTVRRLSRGRILFRDHRARVRAGAGCRAVGRRAAACRTGVDLRRIRIRLRGGPDRLTVSRRVGARIVAEGGLGADRLSAGGGRVAFAGGPGNDRLSGGDGADDLDGGTGNDRLLGGGFRDHLEGGPGRDRLAGGPGNDMLLPADGTRDRVDGGDGRDAANYRGFEASVSLTPRGGGASGERDVFRRIENIAGGAGDDVLTGDGAANRIWGGGGHDRIDARGGDDIVDVTGTSTESGSVDATCGDGADALSAFAGNDRVLPRRDCERIAFSSAGVSLDPNPGPPAGRTVQLSLPCADAYHSDASRVVTVSTPAAGRRWFEAGPFDLEVATGVVPRGDELCPTPVELTDAGLEALRSRGELPVVVRASANAFSPLVYVLTAT